MTEPDVTLTDYGLMLLCLVFVASLFKRTFVARELKTLWVTFFASVALASFTGGTVHGFFLDETSLGYKILWPLTLLSIGVTASAAWTIAGLFIFGRSAMRPLVLFSSATFILYAVVIIGFSQNFSIVILNYMPPMVFLLLASIKEFRRTHKKAFAWIAVGIGISFFAAYVQQAGLAIHSLYFNHNSTYHLIQAFGLYALFRGARDLQNIEVQNDR